MTFEETRRRVVSYAVFAALAGGAWWGLSRGLPRHRVLSELRAHRASVEATTMEARGRTVRGGGRALEDSIAALRARFVETQALVPQLGTGESDADVRRLIAALAERSGVVVRALDEGPGGREGALVVSSARVSATGRYHDVGAWLSMVQAAARLVQVRDVVIAAAADSSSPVRVGGAAPGGASRVTVVASGSFRWFRQDSSALAGDSMQETR